MDINNSTCGIGKRRVTQYRTFRVMTFVAGFQTNSKSIPRWSLRNPTPMTWMIIFFPNHSGGSTSPLSLVLVKCIHTVDNGGYEYCVALIPKTDARNVNIAWGTALSLRAGIHMLMWLCMSSPYGHRVGKTGLRDEQVGVGGDLLIHRWRVDDCYVTSIVRLYSFGFVLLYANYII